MRIHSPQITGSAENTNIVTITRITSLSALSASFASTASFVQNAQSASYVLNAVSASRAVSSSRADSATTASYVLNAVSSSFAATASYADNFTVGGTLTAQTINVQIITSSIEFNTGSTRNGALSTNTHQFTGSVLMSGSLTVGSSVTASGTGTFIQSNGAQIRLLNYGGSSAKIQGSSGTLAIDGNNATTLEVNAVEVLRATSAGNVGIGTSSPQSLSTGTFKFIDISNIGSSQTAGLTMHAQTGGQEFSIHHTNGVYIDVVGHSTATNNFIQFRVASANSTYTSYVDAMRITSGGYVGIGTTSPSSKLHVVTTGTSFTPTATGQIGGNIVNRLHIQSNEPGLMLSSDANGSGSPTGTQTYQLGLQIGVYTTNDIRNQIYFGNSLLSFVYSGDQGSSISERMRISTNGSIGAPNGTNIYNASDIRLKQNISTTTYGLDTISLLNPIKFNWVDGFEPTEDGKDMLGFVAQEVQTIIPEAVESFGGNSITVGDTTIENPLRVNEKFIIPVLVKAIQELKSENDTLKEILQRNNIQ